MRKGTPMSEHRTIVEAKGVSRAHSRVLGASLIFDVLNMPTDPGLLQALGQLAIAHTQLELMLRYTVKTLSGQSLGDALDATSQDRISDLRERIKQLFRELKPTAQEKCQLDALLQKAKLRSDKRNGYLHSTWSATHDGQALMKGERHLWGPAPSQHDVEKITLEILTLCKQLNEARLHGFISKVVTRRNATTASTPAPPVTPPA
jgi:hypothetical protein